MMVDNVWSVKFLKTIKNATQIFRYLYFSVKSSLRIRLSKEGREEDVFSPLENLILRLVSQGLNATIMH